jgi:protein-S-isoprenylcysteine O-methyltransferase Ste14
MTTDALARLAIAALWIIWMIGWIAAARHVKRTRWREPPGTRALHAIPLVLCAALLMAPPWMTPVLTARFAPAGLALALFSAAIVALGLGFAGWARWHIGRNWSGWVTLKDDHALVCTGPYRVVRHPIYTGILLALAGTALALGEWRGVLAVALATLGFVLKLRIEEARMRETFLEYERYRRRVAALIPFVF